MTSRLKIFPPSFYYVYMHYRVIPKLVVRYSLFVAVQMSSYGEMFAPGESRGSRKNCLSNSQHSVAPRGVHNSLLSLYIGWNVEASSIFPRPIWSIICRPLGLSFRVPVDPKSSVCVCVEWMASRPAAHSRRLSLMHVYVAHGEMRKVGRSVGAKFPSLSSWDKLQKRSCDERTYRSIDAEKQAE